MDVAYGPWCCLWPIDTMESVSLTLQARFGQRVRKLRKARGWTQEEMADTRGYTSNDWKQFIYVIYETKRIKPEKQWDQLLRSSDVSDNTSIIVIHGEEPRRRRKKFPLRKDAAGAS